MRDEIFRIWDKEKNQFFKPVYEAYEGKLEDITLTSHGEIIMRTIDNSIHESVFPNRFAEPQFFTGLSDKEGLKIYIGDLIKFPDSEDEYEVIMNDFMKIPVVDNDNGQMKLYKCHKAITVVGNTFQGILQ